jgi:hypothetical protein
MEKLRLAQTGPLGKVTELFVSRHKKFIEHPAFLPLLFMTFQEDITMVEQDGLQKSASCTARTTRAEPSGARLSIGVLPTSLNP